MEGPEWSMNQLTQFFFINKDMLINVGLYIPALYHYYKIVQSSVGVIYPVGASCMVN